MSRMFSRIGSTMVRQVGGGLLQLGISVIVARSLGPHGSGLYSIALLLPTMLSTILALGTQSANVYFVAAGLTDARTAMVASMQVLGVATLLGLLVGAGAILFAGQLFPGVSPGVLLLSLSVFPLIMAINGLSGIQQGLQDFRSYNLVLVMPSAVTLAASAAFALFGTLSIPLVVVAYGIGQLAAAVYAIHSIYRRAGRAPHEGSVVAFRRSLLIYGVKAHASNVLAFLQYRSDLFLTNLFLGPAATGLYSVATQIVERLWILSQAVSTVVLPRLSQLSNDQDQLRRLTPVIARWVLGLTLAGALMLAAIAGPFITILFGPAFRQAIPALLCLLPGIVALACSRVLANDIAARGKPETNFYIGLPATVVNIIACIVLIPPFGIVGAALATTTSYTVDLVLRVVVFRRLTGSPVHEILLLRPGDLRSVAARLRS